MRNTVFFKQAELLLRILPLIHKEEMFALKGGTAINFFVRDLPKNPKSIYRLSHQSSSTYDRDSRSQTIRYDGYL